MAVPLVACEEADMAEVVSVRNLAFSYARFPVWEDVTFSLKEGEIAILVGDRKSTRLNSSHGS